MLSHGGKLREVSRRYGIPINQWLDLSTGVNPRCYPIPDIPVQAWNRLPEEDDVLCLRRVIITTVHHCSPSQAAIQVLPLIGKQFIPTAVIVAIPTVGYRDIHAWEKQGYKILSYHQEPTAEQLTLADVVVIINPNNPTGYFTEPDKLLGWHQQLSQGARGWLLMRFYGPHATVESL